MIVTSSESSILQETWWSTPLEVLTSMEDSMMMGVVGKIPTMTMGPVTMLIWLRETLRLGVTT